MKDFKNSYRDFVAGEQGNSMMIALVVTAILGAGFIGYKSGQEDVFKQFMSVLSQGSSTEVASQESEKTIDKDNPVIAKVDGREIRRQDIVSIVNAMPPQMKKVPLPQLYPIALDQAISNKIVDAKASLSGLENDKDVQKQLYQAKQQIVRAKFIENEVTSRIDDARVRLGYEEYLKNFPDVEEVKVAHILVDDENLAKEIINKLNKGGDFAALAKEYSKDGSAKNGGELGYFTKAEVVPEFAEVAFATKVGTYAKKPVKSNFGYHVVRVDEKRKRAPAEFDKIKPYLAQELQRTVFNEIMNQWKSAVNIERFDINGNPLPAEGESAAGNKQAQTAPGSGEPAAVAEQGGTPEKTAK